MTVGEAQFRAVAEEFMRTVSDAIRKPEPLFMEVPQRDEGMDKMEPALVNLGEIKYVKVWSQKTCSRGVLPSAAIVFDDLANAVFVYGDDVQPVLDKLKSLKTVRIR